MATAILSATHQYHLAEEDRQAILLKSDNPAGKTSSAKLKEIQKQRVNFIRQQGNQFGQLTEFE